MRETHPFGGWNVESTGHNFPKIGMSNDREPVRVGQVLLGVVKSFTDIGALVILPQGVIGHIPRDEVSWLRKRANPGEFFRIGQQVTAKVIAVKRSAKKVLIVTLSTRVLEANPWLTLEATHPANSVTTARVVEFLPFGATVQLRTGFHALLHDSEVNWTSPIPDTVERRRRTSRAADFLRIGETIDVIIQRFDTVKRKIWVSHKLTQPCPWDSVAQDFPPESRTTGFIINITNYGCFVQLSNGCVGLLHQSDAPDGLLDDYGIGDEIPVRIATIDNDRRRIAFALDVDAIEEVAAPAAFVEGRRRISVVNYYERNPKARRACIEHYGAKCVVCGMDFLTQYGEIAEGFVHVHHLKPVSEIGDVYQLDPVHDLRPVCPNCHAVIHFRTPPFSIEEVIAFLATNQSSSCKSA